MQVDDDATNSVVSTLKRGAAQRSNLAGLPTIQPCGCVMLPVSHANRHEVYSLELKGGTAPFSSLLVLPASLLLARAP